jgi:hypothetical protein
MNPAPDGLTTLATVRRFLTELAPELPGELAGDLRAAAKLLETTEIELNERHLSLIAETEDLISHCLRLGTLLNRPDVDATCTQLTGRLRAGHLNLTGLGELWHDTRALATSLVIALQGVESDPHTDQTGRQAAAHALLEVYTCLGAHARSRQPWQSVFPGPRPERTRTAIVPDREDSR